MSKEKPAKGAAKAKGPAKAGTDVVEMNQAISTKRKGANTAELPQDDLMESLKRNDAAFNTLLSFIPAQFYLAAESEASSASDEMKGISTKYMKNKRKQDKTIEVAEKKKHIKEAKRAKLDPDNFKSIAQIQQERAAVKKASRDSSDEMDFEMDEDFTNGSRAGDTDSDLEGDDEGDDSISTPLTNVKSLVEAAEKPVVNGQPSTGILDLRARLQARIQGLQSKRKAPISANEGVDGGPDDESVASTKDELLEERRRKRGEMRDKRRLAMKERRRAEKESVPEKKGNMAGNAKKGGVSSGQSNSYETKAPALLVGDHGSRSDGSLNGHNGHGAVPNNLAFSSLQFGDESGQKGKKNRHALPSDPKAALAILEARKKKDEARASKQGDHLEAKATDLERKERERWSKVEAAAQGIKIRDDEGLLKRAVKKRDKIKDKSRKEWSDRDKEQKDQLAARMKKRSDNIAARKDRSKKAGKGIGGKKMGGGGKKTKARAGFEGRPRNSSKGSGSGKPQKSSRK